MFTYIACIDTLTVLAVLMTGEGCGESSFKVPSVCLESDGINVGGCAMTVDPAPSVGVTPT